MSTIKYHTNLACYFTGKPLYLDEPTQKKPNTRKIVEQPWQQTKGEMWDEVTETLCNLDFIQAKAAAKMTYELVKDFNEVLEVIPDNQKIIQEEMERQARLDKYTQDLIACANGKITRFELEVPESITPWTKEQTDAEIERIKTNPTRADKLKDFLNFLGQEANNLQKYAHRFLNFTTQQAWNYANEGPVGMASEKGIPEMYKSLLIRSSHSRPPWKPKPQLLQNLIGHNRKITSVAMTTDGKYAISGSDDETCILWDMKSGEPIKTLKGHSAVYAVNITPDGKYAITGLSDNTCILWNVQTGNVIQILRGHNGYVQSVAITPNGKLALSGSSDKTCILWDLQTGKQIQILKGHTDRVIAVAITPDGKFAISGSRECILWDLQKGIQIHNFKVDTSHFIAVAITPDGKFAISGSSGCILWDLHKGIQIHILKGHGLWVNNIVITPDGKRAISGQAASEFIFWDLKKGQQINTLKIDRSSGDMPCEYSPVAITPDGRYAISASEVANAFVIWDLQIKENSQNPQKYTNTIHSISISPDGKRAISGSEEGSIYWDLQTGHKIDSLVGANNVFVVDFTADGLHVISGSQIGEIFLSELSKYGYSSMQMSERNNKKVLAVAVTPDGKHAISGSEDETISLWDLKAKQKIHTFKENSINYGVIAVAITPDGQCAISLSKIGTCILWNLKTGQQILREYHSSIPLFDRLSFAIAPDGRYVFLYSGFQTCIRWNFKTGERIEIFKTFDSFVTSVTITCDGQQLVGLSERNCIVWDSKTGNELALLCTTSLTNTIASFSNNILIGCKSGENIHLKCNMKLLHTGIAITTIKQIWDFVLKRFTKPLVYCPLCGHRFEPPIAIIKTIIGILHENNIQPNQSPCLELPDEAWEHTGLLGKCPECHEPLKFNPFFGSDQKGIEDYLLELEKDSEWVTVIENAENAFIEEKWEEAFKLYLKLISAEKFDASYMRYNMALCRINSLDVYKPEIIANIEVLKRMLQEAGENERVQLINDKLIERLKAIKEAEKPWWKKLF